MKKLMGINNFFLTVYLLELEHVLGFHFLPNERQKSREKNLNFNIFPNFI